MNLGRETVHYMRTFTETYGNWMPHCYFKLMTSIIIQSIAGLVQEPCVLLTAILHFLQGKPSDPVSNSSMYCLSTKKSMIWTQPCSSWWDRQRTAPAWQNAQTFGGCNSRGENPGAKYLWNKGRNKVGETCLFLTRSPLLFSCVSRNPAAEEETPPNLSSSLVQISPCPPLSLPVDMEMIYSPPLGDTCCMEML